MRAEELRRAFIPIAITKSSDGCRALLGANVFRNVYITTVGEHSKYFFSTWGTMMSTAKRSTMELYAAAVCFVTVGVLALSAGFFSINAIAYHWPTAWALPHDPPPPPYWMSRSPSLGPNGQKIESPKPPTEQQMAKRREQGRTYALQRERSAAQRSMVHWVVAWVISTLLFGIHWSILRKEKDGACVG